MILLISFGNGAYAKFASNLAHSIKYFCNVEITLASDGCHIGYDMSCIDKIIPFTPADYNNDPCLIKISLNKITPYQHTIYLDVDMVCLQDPRKLFDTVLENNFWIDALRQTDENWWMKSSKVEGYGCPKIFNDVNSSIMKFSKSDGYFNRLKRLYDVINKKDLKNTWGKKHFIPDEVLHSCLLQEPIESTGCVWYCDKQEQPDNAYFLSMYGYGISKSTPKQMYDLAMSRYTAEPYKINTIYKHKFVGK